MNVSVSFIKYIGLIIKSWVDKVITTVSLYVYLSVNVTKWIVKNRYHLSICVTKNGSYKS